MDNKTTGLLQNIQKRVGCIYLSDLHSGVYDDAIVKAAFSLLDQNYTIEEWNEAVSYITKTSCNYEKVCEAYKRLEEKL